MRDRINRRALCSSDNYQRSKRLHLDYLEEKHSHFKSITVNGELSIDVPVLKGNRITPRFKTIRVFGHNMRVSIEEYNIHCKSLGL